MGTFNWRSGELSTLLTRMTDTLGPGEADRMTAALRNYTSAFDDALTGIVATLVDDGDDMKKSEFTDKVTSGRAKVFQVTNTMLDGISLPSFQATLFRSQIQMQDSGFFQTLQKMDLGEARDTLVRFNSRLSDMMGVLDAKWTATTDQDKRIQDAEKQAAKDMADAMRSAIDAGTGAFGQLSKASFTAADWVKSIGDNFNALIVFGVKQTVKVAQDFTYSVQTDPDGIKRIVTGPGIGDGSDPAPDMDVWADQIPKMSDPGKELFERAKAMGIEARDLAKMVPYLIQNPGMDFGDKIEDFLKNFTDRYLGGDTGNWVVLMIKLLGECKKGIGILLDPYLKARQAIVSQMPYEGTILLCFSQSRDDVDKFIENNGIDCAEKYINTVEDDLDTWKGGQSTAGLNMDAGIFAGLVIAAFDKRLNELRGIFSSFVDRNRGKFIGEISDSTQRSLIDLENWNSTRDGLVNLSLDQRLKEWRANCLSIGPAFEDAFSQIVQQVAKLPGAFQARVRDRLNSIYYNLKSQIADAQQDTGASLDAPEKTCNADEIRKVFDRSSLVSALR